MVALSLILLLALVWVPRNPNQCNFIGALIGAGASLIGGALNRKGQKKANAANSPVGQVAQWEQAGINPLFGISSGGYVPQQASTFGDSFAKAGSQFANAVSLAKEQDLRETNLELQNEKLRMQLDELAKPTEPSHLARYGGILPLPSQGGRNAGSQGDTGGERLAGLRADGPQASTERKLKVSTPYGVAETDPRWIPAEDVETEYGDLVALAYSAVRGADMVADVVGVPVANAYLDHVGKPFADWMTAIGQDQGRSETKVYGHSWGDSPPRSIKPTQREIDFARFRRSALGGL